MRIGRLDIDPPLVLGPLAGLTDSPMRRLCRRMGASLVWTEMVSAKGTIRESRRTFEFLDFVEEERPIVFQLFGANPESIAKATRILDGMSPDIIDLNAGCPVKKVVRSGSGAALMRDLGLMEEVVGAFIESTSRPGTVKIRSGWDAESINAPEVAGLIEKLGASAITIHPRTRAQGFTGTADWRLITEVKRSVGIPVIGNGDVRCADDAVRMMDTTGCDAVMIGRGAIGNPWIFREARAVMMGAEPPPRPLLSERLETAIEQLDLMVETKGVRRGVHEMRKHIVAYLRGFGGASKLRAELVIIEDPEAVKGRMRAALAELDASRETGASEGVIQ
jgi:tRNA-dihydrouridine synthase B